MKKLWRKLRKKFLRPKNIRSQQPGSFRLDRCRYVAIGLCMILCVIGARAIMLHLFPSSAKSLSNIADNQYQREIALAPYRGSIYDRRGDALAISIRKPSFAINPRVFDPDPKDLLRLSRLLKISPERIKKIAKKPGYFAWLKRQVDHRSATDILSLGLKGLTEIREPSRFYPAGNAAAHLLGFTGIDNKGLAGIERQFDRDLRGQAMRITAGKDAHGNFIFSQANVAAPEKTGNSIHLTIDRVIQEIAEDELEQTMKRAKAKRGFVIVSDPHTGRILAMANYPSFDPNNVRSTDVEKTKNHALLDVFEPGSVTKPFVIAEALETGKTHPDDEHDCENGVMRIGRNVIHDTHKAQTLTTTETIAHSSNICTYKIALKIGREGTFDALKNFGFGTGTSTLGLPGEGLGRISPWESWKPVRFANVAFGHGFLTTGLEMVQAMGAIANGGTLMKPSLVDRIVSSEGVVLASSTSQTVKRAVNPATARSLREILRKTVEDPSGTGARAKTKLFSTAGKTGTAQKVDPGIKGYAKDKYILSFIGFAPVTDPHLVVYVLIDEPNEKPYYGGVWAAPIFAAVAERSLKYLNVAPDLESVDHKEPKQPLAGINAHVTNEKKNL